MGWKKVTDPAVLDAFARKAAKDSTVAPVKPADPTGEEVTAAEEADAPGWLQTARSVLSGEKIAELPSMLKAEPQGAEQARTIELARRYQGRTPDYRKVTGGPLEGAVQFAANTAADAVGAVASKVVLPVELGIAQTRALSDVAANALVDTATGLRRAGIEGPSDFLFGEAAAKALAAQQERGEYRTPGAITRRAKAVGELANGFAFGAAPTIYAAIDAARWGEDVADASWETFKAYPLASILPLSHAVQGQLRRGGEPFLSKGEPVRTVGVDTLKQQDNLLRLNKAGQAVYNAPDAFVEAVAKSGAPEVIQGAADSLRRNVGPLWKQVLFDAQPEGMRSRFKAQGEAVEAVQNTKSQAAEGISNAVLRHNVIRDIQTALADPTYAHTLEADKLAAIEGTLPGTKGVMHAPAFDAATRQIATELGNELVANGMAVDKAQLAVPFLAFEALRQQHLTGAKDPLGALHDVLEGLKATPDKQAFTQGLDHLVDQNMQNPAFLAAADRAWIDPSKSEWSWSPAKDMAQRDGYIEALNAARQAEQAAGRPMFDLQHPALGELRKDYSYQLFDSLVDHAKSTAEGRQRVTAILRSNPTSRLLANPGAPADVQALVALVNQQDGPVRKYKDAINKASVEIADNLGVDPVVVAKHYDRYLSRAFQEAMDGEAQLGEMLASFEIDPARAARIGALKKSGRFKRTLDDADSAARFMKMVANGDIDTFDVLHTTASHMLGMSQHLASMNALHDSLAANNRIHDPANGPAPKGWVFTGAERVASKDKAASRDPYNFQLGKLANKYVEPHIGKALGLYSDAIAGGIGVVPLWRFLHTVGNAPMYQVRNAIQDPVVIMAISGLNTYNGRGRAIYEAAGSEMHAFAKSVGKAEDQQTFHSYRQGLTGQTKPAGPHAPAMSPDLAEAIRYGQVQPDMKALMDSAETGNHQHVLQLASMLNQAVLHGSTPQERLAGWAEAVAHAKTTWNTPKDLAEAALVGMTRAKEMRARAQDAGASFGAQVLPAASGFLKGLNDGLTETALAEATAIAEQTRRLWAWKVARHALHLPPEDAAVFVSSTMWGADRPPSIWEHFRESMPALHRAAPYIEGLATLVALPPFLRFGNWQLKTAMQRVINDPKLWATLAADKAMQAYNDEEIAEINGSQSAQKWRARLNNAVLQRSNAPTFALGNAKDIADALRVVGADGIATAIEKRDPQVLVNFRDVGGYQTFLHQIQWDVSGPAMFLQAGAVGKQIASALEPDLRNPYTGRDAIPQGDPSSAKRYKRMMEIMGEALFPTSLKSMAEDAVKGVQAAAGQVVEPRKSGASYNPLQALRVINPVLPLQTVDSMDVASRIANTAKWKAAEISRLAKADLSAEYQAQQPDMINRMKHLSANAQAKIAQMKIGFAQGYLGVTPQQARLTSKRIEEARRAATADPSIDVLSELRKSASFLGLERAVDFVLEHVADEEGK